MSVSKISQLPIGTVIQDSDLFPFVSLTGVSGFSVTCQITRAGLLSGVYVSINTISGNVNALQNATGNYYPTNNPSGYVTSTTFNATGNNLQSEITALQSYTGSYYQNSNPSGFLNSGYFYTGVSSSVIPNIYLRTREINLTQTGLYPLYTVPSGFMFCPNTKRGLVIFGPHQITLL